MSNLVGGLDSSPALAPLSDQYAHARPRGDMDQAIADEICRRLIEGESLRAICADEGMPSKSTICLWLAEDEGFRRQYSSARELQAEALADEIMQIADTPLKGIRTTIRDDGKVETVEEDMLGHRRLQVDARKWLASKLAPKKYGDSTLLKHADPDGRRMEMSDEERAIRLASILAELERRAAERNNDV